MPHPPPRPDAGGGNVGSAPPACRSAPKEETGCGGQCTSLEAAGLGAPERRGAVRKTPLLFDPLLDRGHKSISFIHPPIKPVCHHFREPTISQHQGGSERSLAGVGSGVFREEAGRGASAPARGRQQPRGSRSCRPRTGLGNDQAPADPRGPPGRPGSPTAGSRQGSGGGEEAAGTWASPPGYPPARSRPPPSPSPQLQPSARPRARSALRGPRPPQPGPPRLPRLPYLSIPGTAVKEQGHPPHRADPTGS